MLQQKIAKNIIHKMKQRWEEAGCLRYGGVRDKKFRRSSMILADNCWLFGDHKKELQMIVNQLINELLGLDMEPKTRVTSVDRHARKRTNIRTDGLIAEGCGRCSCAKEVDGRMGSWWRDVDI